MQFEGGKKQKSVNIYLEIGKNNKNIVVIKK